MTDPGRIRAFLAAYRTAFESFDPAAIADLFAYPCTISGDDGRATVIPSREAWLTGLDRLVDAYRAIGVRSAEAMTVDEHDLGARLAVALVRWRLAGDHGPLYEFDACYTLLDPGDGLRIVAIAHNETARLRARMTTGRP